MFHARNFRNVPFRKLVPLVAFLICSTGILPAMAVAAESTGEVAEQNPSLLKKTRWGLQNFFKPQDAPPAGDDISVVTMEPVMVVGSRLPSFQVPFADVPANVTYIPANVTSRDRTAVHQTAPRMFQQSIRDVEGAVFFDIVGNDADTSFGLRGFADSSSAIVLVDGVRVNEVDGDSVNYPLIPMHDIDAIQIDRGSASPIFGSNAFSGVVHITTGRPSPKPYSLFGGFEWTSFQGVRFYQGVSGTLQDKVTPIGGKFTYYFNGARTDNNGFRDNSEVRITSFNTKVAYELPEEQGRLHFGVKHADNATSNPGSLPFNHFQANPEQTLKSLDGRSMEATTILMGADKKFWDNRIIASILSSIRYNRVEFATTSITFADFADGFNPDTDLVTTKSRATDLIWQVVYREEWQDWLENQTMIGMEMRDAMNHSLEKDFFMGNIVNSTATETDRDSDLDSGALYWRETLKLFEKVIAHFGMRHDYHWLKAKDYVTPTDTISDRWHESTFSLGLTARPTKATDFFVNYSQGFRVPTISEVAPFSGTISPNLNPEKSDSYEVGTRLRYQDKVQTKLSYFLIDLTDEIVFDSTTISAAAPFGQNVNIAQSRRTGIETRIDAQPIEEVDLYGSYTWTLAYVRETNPTGTLVDGRSLAQVPENRITVGMDTQPFARLYEPLKGLHISIHGIFTGKQHPQSFESSSEALLAATGTTGYYIKSYTVWDFILSYTWKHQQFYFKINNMFDNKYYSSSVNATVGTFGGATVLPPGTYSFVIPGPPREFVLGMKWELG
jgi:outer membrane receptor protein involved in Fe transport